MSLVELLSKKKTIDEKIRREEARVRSIEDKKLSELNTDYNTKRDTLSQWKSDCANYKLDKPAVERFNAMMDQFTTERVKYTIERDIGHVTGVHLKALEPKSFSTLISLYKLDGWFNGLNNTCDKPATAQITEKEVQKAKQEYEKLQAKIATRRGN